MTSEIDTNEFENDSWGWFIDIESNIKKGFKEKGFIEKGFKEKGFIEKGFKEKEYSYLKKSNRIVILYNLVGIVLVIYIFYSIL
jgi:hypothetical protein